MNNEQIMAKLRSLSSQQQDLNARLLSLEQQIENNEINIHNNNENIKNTMTLDIKENAFADVKTGKVLTGENDEMFLDPYYDEEGNAYFYINQFCPIFANILRINHDDKKNTNFTTSFRATGCNPASYTNALISSLGIHSLIDTVGILSFFTKLNNDNKGSLKREMVADILTGKKKSFKGEADSYYNYLLKYLVDDEGNWKCQRSTNHDLKNIWQSNNIEGTYVLNNFDNIDSFIANAEANGYIVDISIGASQFGQPWGMFGSSDYEGHYGTVHYDNQHGISIIDSYGNRRFKYESNEYPNLDWARYDTMYNEQGSNGKKNVRNIFAGQASENQFWHETTALIGTNCSSFEELNRLTKIVVENQGVAIINIYKKGD